MSQPCLADTGLVVAYLNAGDQHHAWAVGQFQNRRLPFLTCDAVIAEAVFLMAREKLPRFLVPRLLATGVLRVAFDPNQEAEAVAVLMGRYADRPMDYADACLVRMSEWFHRATVLTVDSDFHVYRRNRNEAIPVEMPS
ncbi:MAG: PIN domain-containing protein [Rubricoccaceae bacterium]